jgi:hypothetical protein
LIKYKTRPGVLALPATQAAADQAATQSYADTIRRPATAVKNFQDGKWTLPIGSLVIVDDADHLDPGLLASLAEQAAVRTNTKLLLITNHHDGTDRDQGHGADRTRGDGVAVLRESLPWAQHIGTPEQRYQQRDTVIDRVTHHLAAASADGPAGLEAAELLGRHTHLTDTYRDAATARERFFTDMARSRDLSRGLDRETASNSNHHGSRS